MRLHLLNHVGKFKKRLLKCRGRGTPRSECTEATVYFIYIYAPRSSGQNRDTTKIVSVNGPLDDSHRGFCKLLEKEEGTKLRSTSWIIRSLTVVAKTDSENKYINIFQLTQLLWRKNKHMFMGLFSPLTGRMLWHRPVPRRSAYCPLPLGAQRNK